MRKNMWPVVKPAACENDINLRDILEKSVNWIDIFEIFMHSYALLNFPYFAFYGVKISFEFIQLNFSGAAI